MKNIQTPISKSIGNQLSRKHHVPRRVFFGLGGDLHFLVAQRLHQIRIVRRKGAKAFAVFVFALNVVALDDDFLNVAAVDRRS